jgi:hypothetical protein
MRPSELLICLLIHSPITIKSFLLLPYVLKQVNGTPCRNGTHSALKQNYGRYSSIKYL